MKTISELILKYTEVTTLLVSFYKRQETSLF